MLRRFVDAYGPVSARDFPTWFRMRPEPTLLRGGRRRVRRRDLGAAAQRRDFDLTVEPFVSLRAAQRGAVRARAERIGEILEAPVALSFGEVERRPHL